MDLQEINAQRLRPALSENLESRTDTRKIIANELKNNLRTVAAPKKGGVMGSGFSVDILA